MQGLLNPAACDEWDCAEERDFALEHKKCELIELPRREIFGAIVSAIVSIAVLVVSAWTARALHTEKLDSERKLAERRFEYDKDLAERKFRYERDLYDHGRRVELAEQALAAIHEAKGALSFASRTVRHR
jgi:predicted nucleic acid-binding protein